MRDTKRRALSVHVGPGSFRPSGRELPADSTSQFAGTSNADSDAGKDADASCRAHLRPTRVLMVATLFNLPYRVMRCAQASPAEVFVLGNPGARGLRFSRYCRRFFLSDRVIHGGRDEALALEINCLVRELGITMVIPGDAPSTRAIIACRDLIDAPCFPLPSLDHFDALNDKWVFSQLCRDLGVLHPMTHLLPDVGTLAQRLATGHLQQPLIAKPLSRSGSGGLVILDGIELESRLRTINYQPIVVQELIEGPDIGASVYAEAGKIKAFVAHRLRRCVYSTFWHDNIYSDIAKIMAHFQLDGVYNFDMIAARDGSIYYLECNPRFFFKISLSMIAGINFVGFGFPGDKSKSQGSIIDGLKVRLPLAVLAAPWGGITKNDWAMATYLYSDPLPYLMENLHLTV
jgi:ATP-grasp in the biosynthetic pathway with Ter operon